MDKKCCDPGVLWLGQPQGAVEKLGGVDTYVARPEVDTGKAAVLVHGKRKTWHPWRASGAHQIAFDIVPRNSIRPHAQMPSALIASTRAC